MCDPPTQELHMVGANTCSNSGNAELIYYHTEFLRAYIIFRKSLGNQQKWQLKYKWKLTINHFYVSHVLKYINTPSNTQRTCSMKLLLFLLETVNSLSQKFYYLILQRECGLVEMKWGKWALEPQAEAHLLHHLLPLSAKL